MLLGWGSSVMHQSLVHRPVLTSRIADSYLSLASSHGDIHESPCVRYSFLRPALRHLLLAFLRLNWYALMSAWHSPMLSLLQMRWRSHTFGSLRLDFAGTREGAVNFTHDCEVVGIVGRVCGKEDRRGTVVDGMKLMVEVMSLLLRQGRRVELFEKGS